MAKLQIVFVGRKRKSGPRHPCGKLEQERPIDPKVIAFRMPHRAEVKLEDMHDPRAESQIGRYLLNGRITPEEYDAGAWYAKTVSRYRKSIDAPNHSPRSMTMANSGTEPNNDATAPHRLDVREQAEIDLEIKQSYDGAFEVLDSRGHHAAKWVARVAVYDEGCPSEYFEHLRYGLIDLAVHRGALTKRVGLDKCEQIWKKHFRN